MNHHGSLTSLHDISLRRSSAFELKPQRSASRDLLRSALEAHHYRTSNPQLNRKNSVGMWKDLLFIFVMHTYTNALCLVHKMAMSWYSYAHHSVWHISKQDEHIFMKCSIWDYTKLVSHGTHLLVIHDSLNYNCRIPWKSKIMTHHILND